jgi:multidrug resistance efflux pump
LPADNHSGNFIKITHRLPVRISISDPENQLRPGMVVVISKPNNDGLVKVPRRSFQPRVEINPVSLGSRITRKENL